ncbi:MAG: hypothetical protein IKW58_03510 [Alphaproteobacteria bacterium]|nr:hypothetical protein [Alphaproteobacteria bacterium]
MPGLRFNSSHFEEMEDYKEAPKEAPITGSSRKEILQNFLFTKKYESVMMYSARILPPKLVCAKVLVVNLPDYAEKLDAMREEDVFIIGRSGRNLPLTLDVEISEYGTIISCVQAYIVKEGDMYKIFDPSLNGCEIEF